MCVFSGVVRGFQTVPEPLWTVPAWSEAKEILERVRRIDEALGQPDCEEAEKDAWMKRIEERLAKLEESASSLRPLASRTKTLAACRDSIFQGTRSNGPPRPCHRSDMGDTTARGE